MSTPRVINVSFTEATKFSDPFWTIAGKGYELVVRSIGELTGYLSKHDYRYVPDTFGFWRLP